MSLLFNNLFKKRERKEKGKRAIKCGHRPPPPTSDLPSRIRVRDEVNDELSSADAAARSVEVPPDSHLSSSVPRAYAASPPKCGRSGGAGAGAASRRAASEVRGEMMYLGAWLLALEQ